MLLEPTPEIPLTLSKPFNVVREASELQIAGLRSNKRIPTPLQQSAQVLLLNRDKEEIGRLKTRSSLEELCYPLRPQTTPNLGHPEHSVI